MKLTIAEIGWTRLHTIIIRVVGAGVFTLGAIWLYTFLFTDFRTHHAPVMIPIGVATMLLSVGLVLVVRICVIVSVILASVVLLVAAYLQLMGPYVHPFLLAASLISIIYIALLAIPLYRCFIGPGGKRDPKNGVDDN